MGQPDELRLGSYLRSLRAAQALTLRDVETRTKISNAFLSQLESGQVKQPSPTLLYKLAQLYAVPYETLMQYAGYPVPETSVRRPHAKADTLQRLGQLSPDEEQALLDYLGFLRSRARRGGPKL